MVHIANLTFIKHGFIPIFSPQVHSHAGAIVLLFYCYIDVPDPMQLSEWVSYVCQGLNLVGKLRIGAEGINGSVAGFCGATDHFKRALLDHPFLKVAMVDDDFKASDVVYVLEWVGWHSQHNF